MKLTRRGTKAFAIIAVAGMPFLGVAGGSAAAAAARRAPLAAPATNHGVPKILTPTLLHEPGAFFLDAVTCVSTAHCVAVGRAGGTVQGGVLVPITNGVLGTPLYADDQGSTFTSVSCVTATKCVMAGDTTESGPDLAGIWLYTGPGNEITQLALTQPAANTAAALNGVDCTSATRCELVGSATHDVDSDPASPVAMFGVLSLTADPSASVTDNVAAGRAFSITCPTAATCEVAGQTVAGKAEAIRLHGAGVIGEAQPDITELDGIACVSPTSCVASGQDKPPLATTGSGWVEHLSSALKGTPHRVATTAQLPGIARINSGYYLSVGYTTESVWTVALVSAAGTAQPVMNLNLEGLAHGVTCPSPTECIAVGRASDSNPDEPGGVSGTDGAVAILHLKTVSTAPRVTVRSAARTSETVHITAPSNNGGAAVTSYRLAVARCRPHHAGCHLELVKAVHVVPSKLTVKVAGLLAHTTYYFTATATNAIGASPASARVHRRTT